MFFINSSSNNSDIILDTCMGNQIKKKAKFLQEL